MLYTQQTCLYKLLNRALRDHTHPEQLSAFLPYLKLFLMGLNKLPLVRVNKVYVTPHLKPNSNPNPKSN